MHIARILSNCKGKTEQGDGQDSGGVVAAIFQKKGKTVTTLIIILGCSTHQNRLARTYTKQEQPASERRGIQREDSGQMRETKGKAVGKQTLCAQPKQE